MDYEKYQKQFENSLLQYNSAKAFEILNMFSSQENPIRFIDKILVNSLVSIGEQWEKGQIALSQVYMSSKLCEKITESILPSSKASLKESPPMAIAVLADHHVLGKNIVKSILCASGYQIKDFGSGLSAENIIEKAIEADIKILLISVLMYPSALKVKKITDILHNKPQPVKVLVGGAPFLIDKDLWKKIGADAVGENAADDVLIIEKWIREDIK